MKTLLVILGPTGVGKSALSILAARHLGVPIINADSRQIYAELPIGTAAPTEEQRRMVKHYFVGNHHIGDYYNASMFEVDVLTLLEEFFQDSDVALMSGGSMMYIDAVCQGIDDIPTVDASTRELMKRKLESEGLEKLVEELKMLDPEHYAIVDRKNPRRVVHALEICYMTGNTYTSYRTNRKKQRPFRIIKIGLNRERPQLYERINARVIQMMDNGLEQEARRVYPMRGANALNTVGYKEMFDYFDGTIPLEEAVRRIQSNTRQYMRKQLTWFKKDEETTWFNPDEVEKIINYIDFRLSPESYNN